MSTSEKIVNFPVKVYYTPEGRHTCAVDFNANKVCPFYALQKMGLEETCWFADQSGRHWQILDRDRSEGYGYLIPHAQCPLKAESINAEKDCKINLIENANLSVRAINLLKSEHVYNSSQLCKHTIKKLKKIGLRADDIADVEKYLSTVNLHLQSDATS